MARRECGQERARQPDDDASLRGTSEEPRPWLTSEDQRGWRSVGHGKRFGQPLENLKLEIDLTAEQTEWVVQEALRRGIGPKAYVVSLIDQERTTGSGR